MYIYVYIHTYIYIYIYIYTLLLLFETVVTIIEKTNPLVVDYAKFPDKNHYNIIYTF